MFPARGEQEFVAPGETWSITLETFVPPPPERRFVRDVLKLFATTSFADFSFLEQEAVRGGPPLPKTEGYARNPLEELLANAAKGTTRGAKRKVDTGIWITAERILEVRRKK